MKIFNSTLFSGKATVLIIASLALIGTGKLGAQTLVSNLGEGIGASIFQVGRTSDLRQLVFSFTTGSTAADFTGVSLTFANAVGSPGALAFGLYSTYSNASGATGQLSTLTTTGNPLVDGTYSFTGSASLAASTTYYLKLSADSAPTGSNNYFPVWVANNTNETGLTGWTIGNSSPVFSNGSFLTAVGVPPSFSVQGSAIPEPSTYAAIMGLGALGFVVWRRRRQTLAMTPAVNAAA